MTTVFVGSSNFSRSICEKITNALRDEGYEVRPWYERDQFPVGDNTFDSLAKVSRHCDIAVLVFGEDDFVTERNRSGRRKSSEEVKARDNVVLEYGLFAGALGKGRVICVQVDSSVLPRDLDGLTRVRWKKKEFESSTEKTVSAVAEILGASAAVHLNSFPVFLSTTAEAAKAELVPDEWTSRRLYVTRESARLWRRVEKDPQYTGRQGFSDVCSILRGFVTLFPKSVRSIISFGPGVGSLDAQLVSALDADMKAVYIPVDINVHLLRESAAYVSEKRPQTIIPLGVHADLESDFTHLATVISEQSRPSRAFIMLGGTFSNLQDESEFLTGLYDLMESDDVFVLDAFLRGQDYDESNGEPLANLARNLSAHEKRFLSHGITGRIGEELEELAMQVDSYVEAVKVNNSRHWVTEFLLRATWKGEQRTMLHVRRYAFEQLITWLRSLGFEILAKDRVTTGRRRVGVERGLLVLRKS